MLKALFTLDYEIHGNGDGSPLALMVEPTERMLRQFDRHGAKLTILADMGEILQFKRYFEEKGRDDFHFLRIEEQLRDAIRRGHDVQLHLHSSYFNARHDSGRWIQDWSEYNFAALGVTRASEMIRIGKEFLEKLLRPIDPAYRCFVFRAANWSMSPSRNPIRALLENGFNIDTSVFKYGRRNGLVNFDYSEAPSSVIPWKASDEDICEANPDGGLYEFPIYSESRRIAAFLTPSRVYRALLSKLHRTSNPSEQDGPTAGGSAPSRKFLGLKLITRKFAWKADFNQCGGRQLINAIKRADLEFGQSNPAVLPFVLIGHSKLFTRFNEWSLEPFLSFIAQHTDSFGFARFSDFDLEALNTLGPRAGAA